ncbi:MAG TPA: hypothetical protein VM187_11805, partial [Niastella sp.]|nr:hypothetical protein [Niastella sp.]
FTRYLIEFHQVYIPSVGTLRLVPQPAHLDVASKLLHPPTYEFRFTEQGRLSKHQLWYFESNLQLDETDTRNKLEEAGLQLRTAIENDLLTWADLGTFSFQNGNIAFQSKPAVAILKPIPAERVLREGVHHSVLVGDQVVLSDGQPALQEELSENHRNWSLIFGWAAIILSLFFILFYLYQHQFNATASGLQQKVTAATSSATYIQ